MTSTDSRPAGTTRRFRRHDARWRITAGIAASVLTVAPVAAHLAGSLGSAGAAAAGCVGGIVFTDANANGVMDDGDTPVQGMWVKVFRQDAGADLVAGTGDDLESAWWFDRTDATGHWGFGDVASDGDMLRVEHYGIDADDDGVWDPADGEDALAAGVGPTTNTSGNGSTVRHLPVDVSCEAPSVYLGLVAPAGTIEIGDRIWRDINGDGIQSPLEPGITGVVVNLRDQAGTIVDNTITDDSGRYLFSGVSATTAYSITVATDQAPLVGLSLTDKDKVDELVGDNSDSDAVISGAEAAIALTTGVKNDLTFDMGFVPRFQVGNRVWDDLDDDSVIDAGEPGLAGVRVDLAGSKVDVAYTDSGGYYVFSDLLTGSYQVSVTGPVGYVSSSTDDASPGVDANDTTASDNGAGKGASATSAAFSLGPNADAPTGETDVALGTNVPDGSADLTIDFGFHTAMDLDIDLSTSSPSTVSPGNAVDWNLDVSNNGPASAAVGYTVTVSLPAGLALAGTPFADPAEWSMAQSGSELTFTSLAGSPLASGANAARIVVHTQVVTGASGSLNVRSYVSPASGDIVETVPAAGYDDGSPVTGSNNDDSYALTVAATTTTVPADTTTTTVPVDTTTTTVPVDTTTTTVPVDTTTTTVPVSSSTTTVPVDTTTTTVPVSSSTTTVPVDTTTTTVPVSSSTTTVPVDTTTTTVPVSSSTTTVPVDTTTTTVPVSSSTTTVPATTTTTTVPATTTTTTVPATTTTTTVPATTTTTTVPVSSSTTAPLVITVVTVIPPTTTTVPATTTTVPPTTVAPTTLPETTVPVTSPPTTQALGSICSIVWLDSDGDGQPDATETAIAGAIVRLTLPNGEVRRTATDDDGSYCFDALPTGTYKVEVSSTTDPSNGPKARTVSVKGIQVFNESDFGFTMANVAGIEIDQNTGPLAFTGANSLLAAALALALLGLGGLIVSRRRVLGKHYAR